MWWMMRTVQRKRVMSCYLVRLLKCGIMIWWMLKWRARIIRLTGPYLRPCLTRAAASMRLSTLLNDADDGSAERPPRTRGLHSSAFQLNVSAFCGIGGAFRSCLEGV